MHLTIKRLSEELFEWLANIMQGGIYQPANIDKWHFSDWKVAKTIVFMHGMGPLWGERCVNGWQSSNMPLDFRDYLIAEYRNNGLRINKIQQEYNNLNSLLSKNGIRALPFKGIDLINKIYTDPATRPMADVDVYIGQQNKKQVLEILEASGFSVSHVDESGATLYPKKWLESKIKIHKDIHHNMNAEEEMYAGESPNSPCSIDVHFNMEGRSIFRLFNHTDAFEEARKKPDGQLTNEDYLIFLLLHAAKHLLTRSGRWINLYDIFLFQSKLSIDDQTFLNKSIELQVTHLLLIPIVLARKVFGLEVSELELLLKQHICWRHKKLLDKLNLSELSCCNPWAVNHFNMFLWSKDFGDMINWFVRAKNRSKQDKFRQETELVAVPWIGQRLLSRLESLLIKKARNHWNILASHGLDPKMNWK